MKNAYGMILILAATLATKGYASNAPESFTYQGKVFKANGVDPVDAQSVLFKVQIRSADGTCLLFEETHLRDMSASLGLFSLVIGEGTNTNATALGLNQVFDNSTVKSGASCSYTPASGDGRRLRFSYFDGVQTVSIPVDQQMRSVPYAMNATMLAGLTKNKIIQTSASTNQATVDALTAGTSALYAKASDLPVNNGVLNLSGGGVKVADVPATGDAAVNKNYTDNRLGGMNLALSNLADGQVLTWNAAQSKWQASAPALGATTSITTSGNINTTGNISATNISSTVSSMQSLRIFDSANSKKVTLTVPLGMSQDYSLVLPSVKGIAGQVLSVDGSGNASWITPAAGTVTSVAASAPLVSSGGATPSFSLAKADAGHDGYLAAADFVTLSNKLSTTLPNGQMWIGNASAIASPVSVSGDVTMTNGGAFTVHKIQGQALNFTGAAAGQSLKYDGANWTPASLNLQDIKSTVAGNAFAAANCTALETMSWSSLTDSIVCNPIQTATASQKGLVTPGAGLTVSAGTIAVDTGTTANKIVKLDGAGKLPALDASALTGLPVAFQNMQVFAVSGSFTVPANVSKVYVQAWGGGGGGSTGILTAGGEGGGAGGYGAAILNVTPGATIPVTVGAGGLAGFTGNAGRATSFSTLSASGGGGGAGTGLGAGGTSSAAISMSGGRGGASFSLAAAAFGGAGGVASGGGGAGGVGASNGANPGSPGVAPGGGGGGGGATLLVIASGGGAGGAGRVIVWY